ncbi:tagaturonate reductase [Prolixibacteraceae bacterium JC049]|nr:tagaturonate reductase [Prolixibacteraceae bacterium JC049]
MNELNRNTHKTEQLPIRVLQFGEGNFLRAFVNYAIQTLNQKSDFNGGVCVVQPINNGLVDMLKQQDGLYTLYLNGIKNGEAVSENQVISCIQDAINPYSDFDLYKKQAYNSDLRFIVSNTTEAGIAFNADDQLSDAPASSFPGKLTQLLFERFNHFNGAADKGLIFLPCELIDKNGTQLREMILKYADLWNLSEDFVNWIHNHNIFCNTLVDRIVPGYPKDKIAQLQEELGYKDNLIVEGEQFMLWVIESDQSVSEELPFEQTDLNVIFTKDLTPYRTRKVRILNGAHTTMVPLAYLYGLRTVKETVENDVIGRFISKVIATEIIPTLDMPLEEQQSFAADVMDRFKNPYIKHYLISIALNSISKYKTRVLPSLLQYQKQYGEVPKGLVLSLAALICFYKGEWNAEQIDLKDDQQLLDFFQQQWETNSTAIDVLVEKTLELSAWGLNLNEVEGLAQAVTSAVEAILGGKLEKSLMNY